MDKAYKKNKYRLAALDMDGTLLRSDKTIAPATIRDIEAAAEAGIEVCFCSGRGILELSDYIPLLPVIRYAVCTSGAVVWDLREDRILYREGIPAEYFPAIFKEGVRAEAMFHLLTDRESISLKYYLDHMEDYHMGIYKPMFQKVVRCVDDMEEEMNRYDFIPKINLYFTSQDKRNKSHQSLSGYPLTFAYTEDTSLEMTMKGVSKARGLQILADYLEIPMAETVAIGDGDNDREVLSAAGLSVAMGNAEEGIRDMCHIVTDDNDHNGVGKMLRRIMEMNTGG